MTQYTSDGITPIRLEIDSEHYDTTYSITINGVTVSYTTYPIEGKTKRTTFQKGFTGSVGVNWNADVMDHQFLSGDVFDIQFDLPKDSRGNYYGGTYTVGSSSSWAFYYTSPYQNTSGYGISGDCTISWKRAMSTTIIADGLADELYSTSGFKIQNSENIISIVNTNKESFTYSFSDTVDTEAISIANNLTTNSEGSYFTHNNTTYDAWNNPYLFHSTYNKELINKFSDYKFYNRGNGIYEIGVGDGFEVITGITTLEFAENKTVNVLEDIKGTFDQITGLHTDSGKMFRLYNAAFKRFPDSSGLEYWIDKFSSGENTERVIAQSFLISDEFKEKYGENVSNAKYVETLYVNVLGRDYDQSGYNYWLGNLNSGLETRYELLLGFAESAENKTLFSDMTGFG